MPIPDMTDPELPRRIFSILQQGNAGEAERLAREQLAHAPDDAAMLFLHAISLQRQERHAEAVPGYARLTELSPEVAAYWSNYATALRLADRGQEARQAAECAVALAPADAVHRTVLGLAQLHAGDHAAAQASLLEACRLDPASAEAHIHAANALVMVRDAQAYTLLRNWRSWLPLDPPEQLLLAHLLMTIGDADDAYQVLLELMRRAPMHLPARLQLATLHERRNELDPAEALLAETLARFPVLDEPSRLEVAHLQATLAARRSRHAEARTILEAAGPRTPLDYAHWFLLADVQDKLGDTQAAMQSLALAHARQVEELAPLAPSRFAPDAPILPNAVGRLREEEYRAWPSLSAPQAAQSPIFIVGFPRSGTTLLEQVLDAHPRLQSMDERPFFTILGNELCDLGVKMPQDIGRLDQRDCDELRKRYLGLVSEKIRRKWDTRLVDKNPLNMLWLPLIRRLFPESRFILALRHPCDVVLSNYMQNYRSSVLASACSTLERTARAYVAAMDCWLHHERLIHPAVMVSRYEDLVGDLPRQVERIAAFLGLEDATPMLRYDQHARDKGFIATPSYTEVIQPVSRRRMDRWRRYEREFESILPILEPMLRHWGYSAGTAP
jgi:tetratricopeptide (TPR) repeat protein